ncbi:SDR family oxidoreductase [Mucilaginibacter pocheonensis]|uniref:NAD(P)-dependent dehydrogenase (Short-subunit alcohol dehydrogenase family) n=1 Tax=Mucilaginibacter pocheonensis TaxID=398050 RepID=A0ABU1TBP0_9SPHI|nr:SDR family oxidoreductase [Mucilaginibacter pocheonensis]MDR6942782.1 NAD(P)-dependent dehydrogenase (short-subunit alcohol dehydrogenase family) [Mucilaginibacter pocheonensis]
MKTVLITGANKGIGFETAKQLAQLGYFVYLGSREKIKGLEAIKELKASGISNVSWIQIDVTDIHSVQQAKQELETSIGALDVLINNAGIAGEQPQSMSAGKMENLRKVFETNFFGAVQTTQQFIPLLKKSDEPVIINVSSELGSLTLHNSTQNPNYGIYDAYSSSKTALNAFTVLLANEMRNTNFKINSVSPGYTATDLNQHQGTQTVEQGAKYIVNIATSGKDIVTGQFFREDQIPW